MVRRVGGLWERVVAPENLLRAAEAALRRKRFASAALRFAADLELELVRLRRELLDGSYAPGSCHCFWIHDPKRRLISAAPFRDRVVHHALMRVLEPIIDARLVPFTFANRRGLGSHAALRLARQHLGRRRFVLTLDVARFFPSIDHALVKAQLRGVLKCRSTLDLLDRIIDGSPPQEDVGPLYFAGDDLFTPAERRRGLRTGTRTRRQEKAPWPRLLTECHLTSQHLANFHLSPLDRLVEQRLRVAGQVRYMDDLLLFDDDSGRLEDALPSLRERLAALRLRPHPRKTRVQPASAGRFDLWPRRARVARAGLRRARARLGALRARLDDAPSQAGAVEIARRFEAWSAHAGHADARGLLRAMARAYVRSRPACASVMALVRLSIRRPRPHHPGGVDALRSSVRQPERGPPLSPRRSTGVAAGTRTRSLLVAVRV